MNIQRVKFEPYVLIKGFKSLKSLVRYVNEHHIQIIHIIKEDYMSSWHLVCRFYQNNVPKVCCLVEEPLKEGQTSTVDFIFKEGHNHV
jgi:hypothetical protein